MMDRREFCGAMAGGLVMAGCAQARPLVLVEEPLVRPTEPEVGQVWRASPKEPREWAGKVVVLHCRDMSTADPRFYAAWELRHRPYLMTPREYWWGVTIHGVAGTLTGAGFQWLHEEEEILPGIRERKDWQYLGTLNEFVARIKG